MSSPRPALTATRDTAPSRTPGPPRQRGESHADGPLLAAVTALRASLAATSLPFDLEGSEPVRAERREVLHQLDDYVLPRLAHAGRPPLVVVGGPTGVGKSTLVNTLVGHLVSRPGLLRPTTRSPVLVHHPSETAWFAADHLLPTLRRVEEADDSPGTIQLAAASSVPRGIAILDAPDFDSVDDQNRAVAAKVLAAADVWLFVTSAARYSDQLPWRHLEQALARDATVVVVMNRIPPEDRPRVTAHLTRMLDQHDVPRDRSFFIENGPVDEAGLLGAHQVADLRSLLETIAGDATARAGMVRQTVDGAIRRAAAAAAPVAAAGEAQAAAAADLARCAEDVYDAARDDVHAVLGDGSLLTGDLLARWQDLSGLAGADGAAGLATAFGAVRRRLLGGAPPSETDVRRLELALNVALEHVVAAATERAAARAGAAVRATAHGAALLAGSAEDLSRPGKAARAETPRALAGWLRRLGTVVRQELVSSDLADGLDDAGIRALAVAVALHATATPGLLARGAAGADREGLHGLLVTAGVELAHTVDELMGTERQRYLGLVADWSLTPSSCARLRHQGADVLRALACDGRQ